MKSRVVQRSAGWLVCVLLAGAPGAAVAQNQRPAQVENQNHTAAPGQNHVSAQTPATVPAISAQELVRRAIANEDKASKELVRFRYRLRTENPKGSKTQELVETSEGVVARLIAVNDKPPSPEQRNADDQKLNRLLKDPQERARKIKQQKDDEQRVNRMVQSLPDAFIYNYDGNTVGPTGELVRLSFVPNPKWDPPDRERQVFTGMKGIMLIDPREDRLVKIEATLFRDVNFGWGFFGHLDKGGQFIVEQSKIAEDRWETTDMRLRFTGKVLLFKSLNINDHETASNFRQVPNNLSFAQGVDLLRNEDTQLAEKEK
jgi:hypothetical protein